MGTQIMELPSNDNQVNEGEKEPGGQAIEGPPSEKTPYKRDKVEYFYSSLSEVRAELEDLQAIPDSIRKGKTIIPTYAQYIETTKSNLQELMAIVNATETPEEIANNVHTIRHLNNAWEQMQVSPLLDQPRGNFDVQQQLHYLGLLDQQIHSFIYQIAV